MEKDELIYQFQDTGLLTTAMTHSSYANEHRDQHIQNNERLEFLGDSILGLVSADYVFHRYPNVPEGQLTKMRAAVVCEKTLYEVAKELGLDRLLLLARRCREQGVRLTVVLPPMADNVRALCAGYGIDAAMAPVLDTLRAQSAACGFALLDYEWGGSCITNDDTQFFDGFHLDERYGLPDWTVQLFTDLQQTAPDPAGETGPAA